jgi:hypothetical protein
MMVTPALVEVIVTLLGVVPLTVKSPAESSV